MTHHSEPRLLALHAVRVLGFADTPVIAEHAALTLGDATDLLQEAEHHGWVQHSSFADLAGWSLTDEGKAENERLLAAERDIVDPDGRITGAYQAFLPLNARLLRAVTDWQLAVVPTEVGYAAGWWVALQRGVAAVMIIGVEEGGELCEALGFAGVGARVGPFLFQGAVEPLDLAVGLGPVGA